jgi:DNA repair protein RadC
MTSRSSLPLLQCDGAVESATTLYLDDRWAIMGSRHFQGTAREVAIDWELVVRDMMACGSRLLMLEHNHPSGDPTPSLADITLTRMVCAMLRPLRMTLVDHVIWAGERHFSFREARLL